MRTSSGECWPSPAAFFGLRFEPSLARLAFRGFMKWIVALNQRQVPSAGD